MKKYNYRISRTDQLGIGGALAFLAFGLVLISAYLTHLVWSITLLMSSTSPVWNQIILAVLGAFVPPVGTIHGFIIWFT